MSKPKDTAPTALPSTHARERDGKGAAYKLLREVSKLGTPDERRAELMDRLEYVWEQAIGRTYTNKHGDEMPNPDNATALRVVEVADALMNDGDKQQKRAGLVDLAIFKGAERKAG
jgi:hypothetical protein